MKNKRIFVTGGAGYLGSNIVKRYYNDNEITIYSRDEAKHYYLKKQYPNINCIIGDIRDQDLLVRSGKNHDIGIFAASLKQIGAVDQNVIESKKIIIDGAINSRACAEDNDFESACFISSDKSRAATTLYGAMKFVAGESFIVNGEDSNVDLSCAIYGNVLNSTGSVIPLIWDSISKGYSLKLYSSEMTRFMVTIDEAIDLIENALDLCGFNVIPDVKSILIKDLFEIYQDQFGLQYTKGKPRISEKIHEIMLSSEEVPRVTKKDGFYCMHYENIYDEVEFPNNEFSSRDCIVSKNELYDILVKNNFFKKEL
jgi:UDP-glucose 4-epimerase